MCLKLHSFIYSSMCFFPETATVLASSHGATDWGQLCSFRALRQRPAQRGEPPLRYLWQCHTGWSVGLLLPTDLQGRICCLFKARARHTVIICVRYDGLILFVLCWFLQQSNLSNPPTPPASLPPTPPPVNRQKMINGFATTEELANKAAALGIHLDVTSHKPFCTYLFCLSGNELLEGAVRRGAPEGQIKQKALPHLIYGFGQSERPIYCADKAFNLIRISVWVSFLIIRLWTRATVNLT